MKKTLFTAIVPLLILLNACDPVVDYEKAILNSSGSELLLVRNNPLIFDFEDASLNQLLLDSSFLAPSDRQLLNEGFDVGGDVRAFTDCPGYLEEGDTIFVLAKNQKGYQQVLAITQNDFASTYRKLSKYRCQCILTITPEMIE